jgi:hypothetical protein
VPPPKLNLVAVPGARSLAAVPLLAVVGLSKLQSLSHARKALGCCGCQACEFTTSLDHVSKCA